MRNVFLKISPCISISLIVLFWYIFNVFSTESYRYAFLIVKPFEQNPLESKLRVCQVMKGVFTFSFISVTNSIKKKTLHVKVTCVTWKLLPLQHDKLSLYQINKFMAKITFPLSGKNDSIADLIISNFLNILYFAKSQSDCVCEVWISG